MIILKNTSYASVFSDFYTKSPSKNTDSSIFSAS